MFVHLCEVSSISGRLCKVPNINPCQLEISQGTMYQIVETSKNIDYTYYCVKFPKMIDR